MVEVHFTDGKILTFPDRYFYSHDCDHMVFNIKDESLEIVAMIPDMNVLYIRNGDENIIIK